MKRCISVATFSLAIAAIVGSLPTRVARGDEKPEAEGLFELRTYTTNDGKLDALNKRFRDHTKRLFVKHGMTLVGFWTLADGPEAENTLVYMLAYPNRAARDKSWKAFVADPEWQAAFKASRAGGPLVKQVKSQFLNPTDYSPIK